MIEAMQRNPGRYGKVANATTPGELPTLGKQGKRMVVHGTVQDPNRAIGDPLRPQRVAVNAHTDALETEYAYQRISVAAYTAGRAYQAVLEAASGARSPGSAMEPGNGGSSVTAHEMSIAMSLDRARRSVAVTDQVERAIGANYNTLLVLMLRDGVTIPGIAQWLGLSNSWRSKRHAAEMFRQAIEALGKELNNIHGLSGRA